MKKRFFGIYYKHQSVDGHVLAVIVSTSNGEDMVQVIDNEKSYQIEDISSVKATFQGISFNVHQEDLTLVGSLTYGELSSPKKDIMSFFRYLPIECKHNIYSMNHSLEGSLTINGVEVSFSNGNGYLEGDEGRSFPSKYLWLNASSKESSITLAIADIPLGLVHIQGITCLLKQGEEEYRLGTYNFSKIKRRSKDHILIQKGSYRLEVFIEESSGHPLKAPVLGEMTRFIHECPSVKVRYTLKKKGHLLVDVTHPYATYEYLYDN